MNRLGAFSVDGMGMDGIGSSVIVALAAVMWFLYFLPLWLRRREYLATERNAVRLQQTMRVLAESAEIPSVVRVEATARTVAAQQRVLKQQQRQSQARVFSGSAVTVPDRVERTIASGDRTRQRLRRSRVLALLVFLVAVAVGVAFGIPTAATGNWAVLAASAFVGLGAVVLLRQAAKVGRARQELRLAATTSVLSSELHDQADYAPARGAAWTPVPVPRPLYLADPASVARAAQTHVSLQTQAERRAMQPDAAAGHDHAAALRAAAEQAQLALRAAQNSPEVTRLPQRMAPPAPERAAVPASVTSAAPSRFAAMGIIDPASSNATDLDEILRRRRAAG